MKNQKENQLSMPERANLMRQELATVNVTFDTIVSRSDMLSLLDRKLGGMVFDREVADQLIEQVQSEDGRFRIEDFVNIFLQAEDILRKKIAKSNEYISGYEKQRQESLEKFRELRDEEKLNPYGIMEGSKLRINILELEDLIADDHNQIIVRIECENNQFNTNPAPFGEPVIFNQEFNGDIITGNDDIKVMVVGFYLDKNENLVPDHIGEMIIPIEKLRDQYKHDEYFDLYDQTGHLVGGKLHLIVQWIYSRARYLEDVIKRLDEQIMIQQEDKNGFSSDLNTLLATFPNYSKSLIKKEEPKQIQQPPQTKKTHAKYNQGNNDDVEVAIPKPVITEALDVEWNKTGLWGELAFYTSVGQFFLAIFVNFFRADFLALGVPLLYLMNYDVNRKFSAKSESLLQIFILSILGAVLNLIWMSIYSGGWDSSVFSWEPNRGTFEFAYILEHFIFILQCALAFFFRKQMLELSSAESKNPTINLKRDGVLNNFSSYR